ncbi:hypothetical protein ABE096_14200 [Robertmurraya massiliosenegalensis]|uniref:hypothetical protein n=1 Tax=Robertmurraya TaxID=2837507 RepID=UPI0039A56806
MSIKYRKIGSFFFVLLLMTFLTACNDVKSTITTEEDLSLFTQKAAEVYNILVLAQNEGRDTKLEEDVIIESFFEDYDFDSNFYKNIDGSDYHDYRGLYLSLLSMQIDQGQTAAKYDVNAPDNFWKEQENARSYFLKFDALIELTKPE